MDKLERISTIKGWRRQIFEIETEIKNTVKSQPSAREVALAYTNLQQVRHWLGEVLAELGDENPYPESMNPESLVIEPTADKPTAPTTQNH